MPEIPETVDERIAEQQLKGQCHKSFRILFLQKVVSTSPKIQPFAFRTFATIYIFITDSEEVKEVKNIKEVKKTKEMKEVKKVKKGDG